MHGKSSERGPASGEELQRNKAPKVEDRQKHVMCESGRKKGGNKIVFGWAGAFFWVTLGICAAQLFVLCTYIDAEKTEEK